jgi:hypothetical protein
MIMHGDKPVDTIFIHCAATRPEWMSRSSLADKVAEITRWHKERGWTTIGYHWVIDRDGQVAPGRPEDMVGAHVANYNRGSIGICLVGGHGANVSDEFSKNFTELQNRALRSLISDIKKRANIKYVRGHSEVADKACPGFNVGRWLTRQSPKPPLTASTTVQASAVQLASGAAGAVTAVGVLDGKAQIFALALCAVVAAAAAWIMRERIRRWVRETHE